MDCFDNSEEAVTARILVWLNQIKQVTNMDIAKAVLDRVMKTQCLDVYVFHEMDVASVVAYLSNAHIQYCESFSELNDRNPIEPQFKLIDLPHTSFQSLHNCSQLLQHCYQIHPQRIRTLVL